MFKDSKLPTNKSAFGCSTVQLVDKADLL